MCRLRLLIRLVRVDEHLLATVEVDLHLKVLGHLFELMRDGRSFLILGLPIGLALAQRESCVVGVVDL